MQLILIILGVVILVLTFIDFFQTALSGSGFWFISSKVNDLLSKIILKNKSRFSFSYSGLIHIIITTFTWLMLLVLGTFIIFSSGENMVVNLETNMPASSVERFYYSCYTISTLGSGDFVPGSDISRLFTGILSFSGFILLTAAMTYLLSVLNAVLEKKECALYISSLGGNIEELYLFFSADTNLTNLENNLTQLRKMIVKNSGSYVFFPILHHYLSWRKKHSLAVQLTVLHEVLVVFLNNTTQTPSKNSQVKSLIRAIEYYLKMGLENKTNFNLDQENLSNLRTYWDKHGYDYQGNPERDKALDASLKSAGWTWKDVYEV